MKVDKCKGFKDLTPAEMRLFRRIEDDYRQRCLKWGYKEVRTPTLEYLYLFTSVGTLTPGMLRRVYSFLDWDGWSGERVVLKPDGTIPVARMYIENMAAEKVARLFYVTNVFMFDETGKKSRERWQCGAELIGANTPLADAELITLAADVLRGLGIDGVEFRMSHAGLIKALLAKLELSREEQDKVFDRILDGDRQALANLKPDKPELVNSLSLLLDIKGEFSGFLNNVKAMLLPQMPEIEASLDNFAAVSRLIEGAGCKYSIDIASGKGFEYYTGVIFHLFSGGQNIGGGGRYDALISQMGGRDTPAAGFALYMNRIMELVKQSGQTVEAAARVLVQVEPGAEVAALDAAAMLRQAGYIAELDLGKAEATACEWLLKVKSGSPCFTLSDKTVDKESALGGIDEVIDRLGCG
jgi:histidyl-tRNA synthetase